MKRRRAGPRRPKKRHLTDRGRRVPATVYYGTTWPWTLVIAPAISVSCLILCLALGLLAYSRLDAKIDAKVDKLRGDTERLAKATEWNRIEVVILSNRVHETWNSTSDALSKIADYIGEVNDTHEELFHWLKQTSDDIAHLGELLRNQTKQHQEDIKELRELIDRQPVQQRGSSGTGIVPRDNSGVISIVEGIGTAITWVWPKARIAVDAVRVFLNLFF